MEVSIRVMEQILELVTPSENSMSLISVFEGKGVNAADAKRNSATNGDLSAAH